VAGSVALGLVISLICGGGWENQVTCQTKPTKHID